MGWTPDELGAAFDSYQGGGAATAPSGGGWSPEELGAAYDAHTAAQPAPTVLGKMGEWLSNTPAAIGSMVESIPGGLNNLAHAPEDIASAGYDAGQLISANLFGSDFTPYDKSPIADLMHSVIGPVGSPIDDPATRYARLESTARGVGSLAATVLGAEAAPILPAAGAAAGILGFDKANQATGSDAPTSDATDLNNFGQNLLTGGVLGAAADVTGRTITGARDVLASPTPEDAAASVIKAAQTSDVLPALTSWENRAATGDAALEGYKTAAEVTKDPGLSQLQETLSSGDPQNTFSKLAETRANLRSENLNSAIGGATPTSVAGDLLRSKLEGSRTSAMDAAAELAKNSFEGTGGDFPVDSTFLQKKALDLANESYTAASGPSGPPRNVRGLLSDLQSLTDEDGKIPYSQLQKVKAVVGDLQNHATGPEASFFKRVYGLISKTIEDQHPNADAWRFSQDAFSKAYDQFDNGVAAQAVRSGKGLEGYAGTTEGIPAKFFSNESGMKSFDQTIGKDPEAVGALRGAALDEFYKTAYPSEKDFSRANAVKWMKNRSAFLDRNPDIRAAIKAATDDAESQQLPQELALKASGRQSATAPRIAAAAQLKTAIEEALGYNSLVGKLKSFGPAAARGALGATVGSIGGPIGAAIGFGGSLLSKVGDEQFANARGAKVGAVEAALRVAMRDPAAMRAELTRAAAQSPRTSSSALPLIASVLGVAANATSQQKGSQPQIRPPSQLEQKTAALAPPSIISASRVSNATSVLPTSLASYLSQGKNMGNADIPKEVMTRIEANPYLHAAALTESNMKADAVPRDKSGRLQSSAKGLYQLTDATAKSLGVKDPFNAAQNLEGMEKLTEENSKALGTTDPEALYAAHVLGAPLAKKWIQGKNLTDHEETLVRYFLANLPRFQANYAKVTGGAVLA